MAKRKKKHGRPSGARKDQGFYAYIGLGGFKNPAEVKAAFREMEEDSYRMGRTDREQGRGAILYAAFEEDFDELRLPREILAAITRANYAVYMDAYRGRAFKSRTICEVAE